MKKTLFLAALLVCAGVAAVYAAIVPGLRAEREQEVAAFLASLPGEVKAGSIRVELLPGNVILRDFTGRFAGSGQSSLEFSAPEFVIKGLGGAGLMDALFGKRPADTGAKGRPPALLARGASASGFCLTLKHQMEGTHELLTEDIRTSGIVLRDITGDLDALVACLLPDASLQERLHAAAGFSAALLQITGYSKNISLPLLGNGSFLADNLTLRDVGLFHLGKGVWEGLSATIGGERVLSVERITLEGLYLPDVSDALLALEQSPEDEVATGIFAALEKEPLVVNNLELTDLRLLLGTTGQVYAKRLALDISGDLEKMRLRHTAEDLCLPPGLLALPGGPYAAFAAAYAKNLCVSAELDMTGTHTGGKGDLDLSRCLLDAADLGALSFTGSLAYEDEGEERYFDSDLKLYLRQGEVLITERNMAEYAIRASLAGAEQPDEEQLKLLRGHLISAILLDAQNSGQKSGGQGTKAFLEGFAKLVEGPGSLRVVFTPNEPVSLDSDDFLNEANPAVEFTAAPQAE